MEKETTCDTMKSDIHMQGQSTQAEGAAAQPSAVMPAAKRVFELIPRSGKLEVREIVEPEAPPAGELQADEDEMSDDDSPESRAALLRAEIERAVDELQKKVDDDRSFRVIFDAYFEKLRRYFARKGVPQEDCLDLTNETFFRIYKGMKGLRDKTRFEGFLWKTALRVFLKWLERLKREEGRHDGRKRAFPKNDEIMDYLVSDELWPTPLWRPRSPEEELGYKDLCQRMKRAIAKLPTMMGRCAWLKVSKGLTNSEIAEALRIASGNVGYQLHQARKRLPGLLNDQ